MLTKNTTSRQTGSFELKFKPEPADKANEQVIKKENLVFMLIPGKICIRTLFYNSRFINLVESALSGRKTNADREDILRLSAAA